jgi:hypothetical protein
MYRTFLYVESYMIFVCLIKTCMIRVQDDDIRQAFVCLMLLLLGGFHKSWYKMTTQVRFFIYHMNQYHKTIHLEI